MESRQFSMKQALALLGIKPPKVSKKQTQAEIDAMVASWKENELEDHYKTERKKWHPDINKDEGAERRFKDLGTAFSEIKEHLKLRKPKIPPEKVTNCRSCNASRIPNDAAHCWECGLAYRQRTTRISCPVCATPRNPSKAKFCHGCGYDYQVPDGLIDRLRSVGFTEPDIRELENKGTLAKWRQRPPMSKDLGDAIQYELTLRKIGRGEKSDFGDLFGHLGRTR